MQKISINTRLDVVCIAIILISQIYIHPFIFGYICWIYIQRMYMKLLVKDWILRIYDRCVPVTNELVMSEPKINIETRNLISRQVDVELTITQSN